MDNTQKQQTDQLNPLSLVGSIFKFSIATWVNAILYLATLILASYVFGDSGVYGMYNLFYYGASTVMSVAMLGLDYTYIRFYKKPPSGMRDSRQLAAACMGLSIVSLLLLSFILCLGFPKQISRLFFSGDATMARFIVLLCVNAFFLLVTRYFNITYRMQQNVKMYTLQTILLQFFSRMFFIVGALFNPSLDYVIWFSIGGLGIFTLVFFLLQRRTMLPEKVDFPPSAYKPLLKYGLPLVPAAIIQYVNTLFSSIYVNVVMGPQQLGIFSFMSNVSLALGVVQAGFATFWSAFIFGNYKTEHRKIRRVHDYLTFIMLSLMAVLIALQPVIFRIFGESYRAGEKIFGLMLFAPMLLIISETTVYGIEIAKKTIYNSIAMAIYVGGNALLCVLLVERFGMVGAALALAIAGLAMFIFRTIVAQRFYKTIDHPIRTAFSIFFMATLCGVSYWFAARPAVVALSACGLLVYYAIVYHGEFRRCLGVAGEVLASLRKKNA